MSDTPTPPDETTLRKVPTGIEGLDVIVQGGFLEGGITIIQGKPGVGKTILGNQLCFNHAARGGRALYVTLLAESHARMLLHIGNLAFFHGDAIPDQVSYISGFPVLEAEGTRGLLNLLRREVQARCTTLMILDGLVAAEKIADSDIEFKKFIHELQAQATMANCMMFLLTSGNDDHHLTTAEHTMVDSVIQMRSRLYGWRAERDLEILKRRGDGFLLGRHAFRISDAGITVFPRFEALFAAPTHTERDDTAARVSTGLAPLDTMLDGGLPQGSCTLLVGPSGSGKTSFGLHFLSQCSPAEPGLFFGFYEAPAGLRAKARSLGLAVSGLIDRGDVALNWQPTTEALLDEACTRLLDSVRTRHVRRLVLDGLGGFTKLAEEPERVGYILTALVNELRALGVTTVFTKETDDPLRGILGAPALGGSPITVSEVADNIVLFQFVPLRSRLYRTLSVLKARDSRIDDRLRLFEMTSSGLVVDDSPDRAEAILVEVAGQAGPGPHRPVATTGDPRLQGR
jgi:circadian clock protein KaiC